MHMHIYKNSHTRSSQRFEQEPTVCDNRDWLIANLTDERMVRIQRMREYSTCDLPEFTIDQGESIVSTRRTPPPMVKGYDVRCFDINH